MTTNAARRRPARSRRPVRPPEPPDSLGAVALWLVVGSAAVVLPGGLDRFVLVKTLVIGIAVAVGVGARRTGRLPRWAVVGLAAGALWLGVAALASDAPWAQLWGRWPRYEGLITLPAAVGALWLGARVLGPTAPPDARRHLERAAVTVAGLVGGVAVLEALGVRLLSSTAARPGSLLGNASDQGILGGLLAAVLVPVVVAALAREASGGSRVRAVAPPAAGLALSVAAVVLSGSRGALLGLACGLLTVTALLAVPRVRGAVVPEGTSARAVLVVPAAALAAAAALALVLPQMADRLTGTSPLAAGTVEGRRLLWSETVRLVADHPVTGVGPSGFVEAIPAYHTARWAAEVGPANPPDSPHAWPLQTLVAGGVPLLLIALALAVLGARALTRSLRTASDAAATSAVGDPGRVVLLVGVAGAAVGYAVAASTHLTSPGTTGVLTALLGAGIAVAPRDVPGDVPRVDASPTASPAWLRWPRWTPWLRRGGVGLLGVWLLVVAAATVAEWPLRAAYDSLDSGRVQAGGAADRAFGVARALRPWDGDVAVLAAHAFGTTAAAGIPEAAEPARTWATRALDAVPSSSLAVAAQADAAEATGDLAGAETLFTTLVSRDPANAEWPLRRGVVRANLGDLLGAEADFLLAARLAPSSAGPWQNLAALYDLMGRVDDRDQARDELDRRSGGAGG